ncbi:6-pyruvoyl tetrahydrobiopterin synthase [Corynebacterium pyruviciproducens]|uniref:6-pyruvoyl tetrahydrobiopterin synthase n=2 Tax=Corynebacterium pyruviciproducens TaxID=598660 RepID=UPI0024577E69|nr:6-pyruvoyl tetrahydrobiopterin synthase [Corynebacterium pyruviciproducens]MDH4657286.1 6-pyruvoyl tetrahydrobiopterin synthase [Corynebacterium pyruviciproducens]
MSNFEYNAEVNEYLGAPGMACMHGEAQSSDCSPVPGPGAGPWDVKHIDMGGACPTIMIGSDGFVQALVTQRFGSKLTFLQPKVAILDPETGRTLGSLEVPKGALLGGVYAFIDNEDRMVFVDGSNTLLRVAHSADGSRVYVDERVSLTKFLSQYEGDQVVGVVPDWQGRVWVASAHGALAVVDVDKREIRSIFLNESGSEYETVDNSISACPSGVSVVTSHAIYMLSADDEGTPSIDWFALYDRGTARKPGQLSWGSGASPTFFGPNGSDYVMLTDNADEQENLIVYETTTGRLVGSHGVFTPGASGTECSAIGVQNSIVVGSTFGYPYPRYPEGAGPSKPANALFAPGLERYDVTAAGLTPVWKRDDVYSAVVPRLSTADGYIYVCERKRFGLVNGSVISGTIIDMETGETVYSQDFPGLVTVFGVDTLQMVGTIDDNGTWWQGTVGGIFKITKK